MTDTAELAEILRLYTEEQRRDALNQQRWRKITLARVIGETQVQCETVIDQTADAGEIHAALAPLDAAIERLKAKSDLADHYWRMLSKCGELEMSRRKYAADHHKFQTENAKRNENRRNPVLLTDHQQASLRQIRESITDGFERIEEMRSAAAECRRVVEGENPIAVLEEQLGKRLDKLRAMRQDAA